jgi:hypothetical protein
METLTMASKKLTLSIISYWNPVISFGLFETAPLNSRPLKTS